MQTYFTCAEIRSVEKDAGLDLSVMVKPKKIPKELANAVTEESE